MQGDFELGVIVLKVQGVGIIKGADAELFGKFPLKRVFRAFSGLKLAAGKLPLPAVGAGLGSARGEDKFILFDDGRSHKYPPLGHRPFSSGSARAALRASKT